MKKRILVPVDLSQYSKAGLEAALTIAENTEVEINILHVIEEETPVGINTTADITLSLNIQNERNKYIIELMNKKHQELINYLKSYNFNNAELKTFVEVGEYTNCLNNVVRENDIDLIIMGTSGETSLTELTSGNYSEKTTRETTVPVLSIKEKPDFTDIKTLGFLIDLEQPNLKLIELINNLTKIMHYDLVLLHKKEMEFLKDSELIVHLRLLAREYGINPKAIHIMNSNINFTEDLYNAIKKYSIDIIAKTVDKKSAVARLLFEDTTEELINDFSEPALLMSR